MEDNFIGRLWAGKKRGKWGLLAVFLVYYFLKRSETSMVNYLPLL